MRRRLGGSGQAEFGVSRLTIRFIVDDAAGRLDPHFVDYTTGVVSGGFGSSVNNRSGRDGVHGSLRQVFGRHAMKLGVEYENNQNRQAVDNTADPGAPQGNIERYDETTYVGTEDVPADLYTTGSSQHTPRTRGIWGTG